MKGNQFTNEDLQRFVRMGQMSPVGDLQEGTAAAGERLSEPPAAVPPAGSGTSITDPAKTKAGSDPREVGGFDWMKVRVTGRWQDGKREATLKALKAAQDDFRNGGTGLVRVHEGEYAVYCPGHMGSATSHCGLILHYHGVQIAVTERELEGGQDEETIAWVQASSRPLMRMGVAGVENVARFLLAVLGVESREWYVSRIDLCVDLPGVGMDDIEHHFHGRNFVSQAGKFDPHYDGCKLEGVTIGRGKIQAKIYDKLKCDAKDEDKLELLKSRRWGGRLPDKAIRVEFQVMREALAEHSIATWQEAKDSVHSFTEYLATGWLRLADDVDHNHADRSITTDVWRDVQAKFKQWTAGAWRKVRRRTKSKPAVSRLVEQVRGCLSSIVARLGDYDDPEKRQGIVDLVFRDVWQSSDFVMEVKHKRAEFAARGRAIADEVGEFDYESAERHAIRMVEVATEWSHRTNTNRGDEVDESDFPAWVFDGTWE